MSKTPLLLPLPPHICLLPPPPPPLPPLPCIPTHKTNPQPLDFVLGRDAEGRRYVSTLMKLLAVATADRTTQYYAVSRLKGVLTEDALRHSRLFLPSDAKDATLDAAPLLRAIRVGDAAVQGVASVCLALLCLHLGPKAADPSPLVSWACEQLKGGRGADASVRVAVAALTVALRGEGARGPFAAAGGVGLLANLLRMQVSGSWHFFRSSTSIEVAWSFQHTGTCCKVL